MTNQTRATLYFCNRQLEEALTLGLVEQLSQELANQYNLSLPLAYSLEPTNQLPVINGEITPGRIKNFAPLMRQLPSQLAELPLQSATLHGQDYWVNLVAQDALSNLPAKAFLWFTSEKTGCDPLKNLEVDTHLVLPWQDTDRFNLTKDTQLALEFKVKHYLQNGKRLTWQLAFNNKELNHEKI